MRRSIRTPLSPATISQTRVKLATVASQSHLTVSKPGKMELPPMRPLYRSAMILLVASAPLIATTSCRPAATGLMQSSAARGSVAPTVQANDNRLPAGTLRDGTLRINLTISMARWYPEAEGGPFVDVAAFGEEGRPPQIPAPLIRVPLGTTVVATIRNSLSDSTVYVYGLVAAEPGQATSRSASKSAADAIVLRPGESRTVRFAVGSPGTYLYHATLGSVNRFVLRPLPAELRRMGEREQLSGALVVDSLNARADERIFVMNIWAGPEDSAGYRRTLTINGKSWPHTERIDATTGDSLRWRIVNGSTRNHPMHLHGFYFRIDSRGTGRSDTTYAPADRRLAVTEALSAGQTMSITWSPERPGNWLFHCHTLFHVTTEARLTSVGDTAHAGHGGDPLEHMAGLIIGISVRPSEGFVASPRGPARQLHLFVNEGKPRGDSPRAMSFVLQQGGRPPATDSMEIPGTVLVLTRDEPTDITVVNRLADATAVHWHGIELESFSDGVAGWSGANSQVASMIAPADSFVARLTMPRTGTFIYHTHLKDLEQLTSGLYGAIVVLKPGERFDPSRDHVFVTGWDGETPANNVVVNGDKTAPPMELAAGVTHRLRFVNISPAVAISASLRRDSAVVSWRRRAKDGADLPASAARVVPALQRLEVGETFDAEFTPPSAGVYTLAIAGGPAAPHRYVRKLVVR